jgi:hypothetical protein
MSEVDQTAPSRSIADYGSITGLSAERFGRVGTARIDGKPQFDTAA